MGLLENVHNFKQFEVILPSFEKSLEMKCAILTKNSRIQLDRKLYVRDRIIGIFFKHTRYTQFLGMEKAYGVLYLENLLITLSFSSCSP